VGNHFPNQVEKTFETDGKTTHLTLFGPIAEVESAVDDYFKLFPWIQFETKVIQRTVVDDGWVAVGVWRRGTTSSQQGFNRVLR